MHRDDQFPAEALQAGPGSARLSWGRGRACAGDRARRGFTLIELMVVLTLLLIVLALVGMSISNIRKADLKSSSGMLAAAMRYTYNLAVINGTPYRLVIDMDEGRFWGEELKTDDPCARYLPEEGSLEDERGEEDDKRGKGERGEDQAQVGPVGYSQKKDNLLSKRKLPKGIRVTGVMTSHHREAQHSGSAAIHFFPNGDAEQAWVWLGEESGPDQEATPEVTVQLDGLMGHVKREYVVLDENTFQKELE